MVLVVGIANEIAKNEVNHNNAFALEHAMATVRVKKRM